MPSDEEVLLVPKGRIFSGVSPEDRLTSDFEVEKARTEDELGDIVRYLSHHIPSTRLELSKLLRQQAERVQRSQETDEYMKRLLFRGKTE